MNRKDFFKSVCALGACSCLGGLTRGVTQTVAQDTAGTSKPGDPLQQRALKRMEFADKWVKRFFDQIDANVDESVRKKLMMANGRTCYRCWIEETGQKIKPVTFERYCAWSKEQIKEEGFRIEGNTIYFQYNESAETGSSSAESICLCPMVEHKPAGMSPTYCWCSVGYVKEMYSLLFEKPVTVELLDSVLLGGKRCKFKITVG
jgi:predicted hydrocarbon binding protein